MGVDPKAAEFAEEKWGAERDATAAGLPVRREDYDALLRRSDEDHTLMQSRIDNQKAVIDRQQVQIQGLKDRIAELEAVPCQMCAAR